MRRDFEAEVMRNYRRVPLARRWIFLYTILTLARLAATIDQPGWIFH